MGYPIQEHLALLDSPTFLRRPESIAVSGVRPDLSEFKNRLPFPRGWLSVGASYHAKICTCKGKKCVLPQYPENGSYMVINDTKAGPGDAFDDLSLILYTSDEYFALEVVYVACVRGTWSREILKRVRRPMEPKNHLTSQEASPNTRTQNVSDRCELPLHPEHGQYEILEQSHAGHNDSFFQLVYWYEIGYSILGVMDVNCSDGVWSDELPTCIGGCRLDYKAGIYYLCKKWRSLSFSTICDIYEYVPNDAEVLPVCDTPYYRSSTDLPPMKCVDGNWNYTPACLPVFGINFSGQRISRYRARVRYLAGGGSARNRDLLWHTYNKMHQPYMQICSGSIISAGVVVLICSHAYVRVTLVYFSSAPAAAARQVCPGECGTIFSKRRIRSLTLFAAGGWSARNSELPWHVAIYNRNYQPYMQICGGSIISAEVVVTGYTLNNKLSADHIAVSAAHCFWKDVEGLEPSSRFAVAAGKLYRPWSAPSDHSLEIGTRCPPYALTALCIDFMPPRCFKRRCLNRLNVVNDIVIPKRFRGVQTDYQDDIAIVYLSKPLSFNFNVWPVCIDFDLKLDRLQLTAGNLGKVAGWGLIDEDGKMSPELQVVHLPYVEIDQCIVNSSRDFRAYITSDKICAGHTNVAPMLQLTPGSGPWRTPRRGAAGSDANSPGLPHLPRVQKTSGNYAVEVAPDAHGDQRRPSCVCVCCRIRAPCAALRAAPRTGLPFCDYPQFIEIPDLHHCTKADVAAF
ncbi:Modular serine protease [Eumeta japonica]|uniref:Modular serine protease n=1 Tax=Eumeta variegata TaxID=151549 RepID=A0A4C1UWI5_EUMVA|nr:Modular serine protease [Eumeta japonica]